MDREKKNAQQRAKYQALSPDQKKAHADETTARRLARPDKGSAIWHKSRLKLVYGLTPEEYDAMLERQGGGCAICGTTSPMPHAWFSVDHDHNTGAIRGLLCNRCNVCIGRVNDDPELLRKALTYLEAAC